MESDFNSSFWRGFWRKKNGIPAWNAVLSLQNRGDGGGLTVQFLGTDRVDTCIAPAYPSNHPALTRTAHSWKRPAAAQNIQRPIEVMTFEGFPQTIRRKPVFTPRVPVIPPARAVLNIGGHGFFGVAESTIAVTVNKRGYLLDDLVLFTVALTASTV